MRIARLFRHRRLDETDARRALGDGAVARLEQRVRDSEHRHSGEIRLCVEAGLPLSYLWRDLDARDRAVMMFSKLRVWDTEHNNGVLIYLLLAERRIEIVADRGLAQHVPDGEWARLVAGMGTAFREGQFEQGLTQALDAVGALLQQHFALAADAPNSNELSDRVDLR